MIDYGYGVGLRKISEEDLSFLFKCRNDFRVRRWCRQVEDLSWPSHEKWFTWQATDPYTFMYSIIVDDELVGVCGLTTVDFINRRGEFSLYINPELHWKGLGKKTIYTLFRHGFSALNLNRIYGETFVGNPAATLFEKLGMEREGVRREYYYKDGNYIDCILFSINRERFDTASIDFFKTRKADEDSIEKGQP